MHCLLVLGSRMEAASIVRQALANRRVTSFFNTARSLVETFRRL